MPAVLLDPSLPKAFPLAFGCASLGGRYTREESLRALAVAFDHCVNVFDTARSYGYGESEAIVGEFARGRRDRLVISTKVGIRTPPVTRGRRLLKAAARRVFSFAPGLRSVVRSPLGAQHSGGHFDPAEVRASVEESLRQLGTDRIDVLFLHDVPADQARREDLIALLETLRTEGKVVLAGPSTSPAVLAELAAAGRGLGQAVQFSACAAGWRDWPPDFLRFAVDRTAPTPVRFGNRPFAGGSALDQAFEARLAAIGPRSEALLRLPLEAGICDVVVTSMLDQGHVIANCRAILEPKIPAAALAGLATSLLGKKEPSWPSTN
jgi:hypothetical protein